MYGDIWIKEKREDLGNLGKIWGNDYRSGILLPSELPYTIWDV